MSVTVTTDAPTNAPGGAPDGEIAGELVRFEELPPEQRDRVDALIAKIDIRDSHSIIAFGAEAQRELTTVSEQILDGVRNKDTGPAGAALGEMMLKVRDLDVGGLKNGGEPGWFERVVLRRISPLAKFLQRYETVQSQVEKIEGELEGHRLKMTRDITRLDKLYDVTLDYYHSIADYIVAAEERLRSLDTDELPELKAKAEDGGDMLATQRFADATAARNDLERKIHDLKLTRQVTMQNLPSIRMNQELDKSLVVKIQSVMVNTLPLWKNQLAQAVTLFRTREAADVLVDVSRTTNELLETNAESLKGANASVRQIVEQGAFSIDSIERANQSLIDAIEDSLRITREGRQKRAEAEQRLVACEGALKQAMQQSAT